MIFWLFIIAYVPLLLWLRDLSADMLKTRVSLFELTKVIRIQQCAMRLDGITDRAIVDAIRDEAFRIREERFVP